MAWVAVAVAGASLVGGAISANAAQNAADQQAQAAQNAQNLQTNMYNQTVNREAPFVQGGQAAQGQLDYLLGIGTPGQGNTAASSPAGGYGSLNAPFTAQTFQQYAPAYQFQLQQGQQGVLNGDSSSVGAGSGAALKDLTSFNQNFANTSFNNAFNQYQTQQGNIFSRLAGIAQQGQAAASNSATGGSNYGASIGQSATNVGTALAGGTVGSANAITGALNGAAPWLAYGNSQNSQYNPYYTPDNGLSGATYNPSLTSDLGSTVQP